MKPHCYLIIGSTGLIGKSISNKLIKKSNDVFTISRSNLSHIHPSKHFVLDLLETGSISSVINDLKEIYKEIRIFYLAGLTSVSDSMGNSLSKLLPTIDSYIELVDCVAEANCSLVFASTGAIYDGSNQEYFDESSQLRPISPYSLSKYRCEGISFASFNEHNSNIKIARLFSVYGEKMTRFFIFDLVKKLLTAKNKVCLMGDGTQVRDYLHVDIVSEGLLHIMEHGKSGEAYNLCSGVPISLNELALTIKKILGEKSIDIQWDNEISLGSYDRWYGNPLKISNLGFKPKLDFENNLEKTVLSLKNKVLADI